MSEYNIEKGVPLPQSAKYASGLVAILRALKVNDSILIADKTRVQISSACHNTHLRWGHRFVTRKVEGGIRIWRVK